MEDAEGPGMMVSRSGTDTALDEAKISWQPTDLGRGKSAVASLIPGWSFMWKTRQKDIHILWSKSNKLGKRSTYSSYRPPLVQPLTRDYMTCPMPDSRKTGSNLPSGKETRQPSGRHPGTNFWNPGHLKTQKPTNHSYYLQEKSTVLMKWRNRTRRFQSSSVRRRRNPKKPGRDGSKLAKGWLSSALDDYYYYIGRLLACFPLWRHNNIMRTFLWTSRHNAVGISVSLLWNLG